MEDADEEQAEFTVMNKGEVLVYEIPPNTSSSGHKADEWKKCIWRGSCRVVGKGKDMYVKMLDGTTGALFAQCHIPNGDHDKYVERTIDSSRYFVLKIKHGERHAFVGLGFEDRNDAFDFNCALNDFKTTFVEREIPVTDPKNLGPTKDLSIKEGQTIAINFQVRGGDKKRDSGTQGSVMQGGSVGFGLMAPPPPAGQSRRKAAGVSGGYAAQQQAPAPFPGATDDCAPSAAFPPAAQAVQPRSPMSAPANDPIDAFVACFGLTPTSPPLLSRDRHAAQIDAFDIFT